MSKTLAETLDAMANEHASKSETARLRAVFAHVENALRSGVSRQAVLNALHQDGFTFSMQSFEKALYRIRKSQVHNETPNASGGRSVAKPSVDEGAPTSTTVPVEKPKRPSVTPSDLRKIRQQEHDWVALSQPVKD